MTTLDTLLTKAAVTTPHTTAVVDGDREINYAELDRRTGRVADRLASVGVGRGDLVGLHLEKSIEAVVGLHAILRVGAAYVPLDVTSPPARVRAIVVDAGLRAMVVCEESSQDEVALPVEHLVPLSRDGADPAPDVVRDDGRHSPEDSTLAYVLYTSGSMGIPKGVELTHRNAFAFVAWAVAQFELTENDRMANHAPLHFDLSVLDVFGAAAVGATLVLVPSSVSVFPRDLADFIREKRISVWYSVPSVLTLLEGRGGLDETDLPDMRLVLFAGEVFPLPALRRLMEALPHATFHNLFGPTETNVCMFQRIPRPIPNTWSEVPIGRPITDVECLAMTPDGRLTAAGECGELWVRGPTVMRGYANDPARTEKVLTTPPGGGKLAYRTGDVVWHDEEGTWWFVGRRDSQIKSRGYRIERGDVEAALIRHPSVLECAVAAVPDSIQGHRLEAFVIADSVATRDLVAHCRRLLPSYMVPHSVQLRDDLPRTSNGKVDYRYLATNPTHEEQR